MINSVLVTGILCFSLAISGCSAKSSSSSAEPTTKETEAETTTPATTEAETTEPETTEPETTEPETETAADDGKSWFDLGTTEDGVYTNEQSGITITPTEDWTIFTREQLDQVAMQGYEYLSEDQKKLYETAMNSTKYLFGAAGSDGSSLMYMAENLSANPITANMNEEGYLKNLTQQLEQMSIGYEFGESTEIEIAGRTWISLPCYGAGMAQNYLVCKADGKIESFIITVPGADEDKASDIIAFINGL